MIILETRVESKRADEAESLLEQEGERAGEQESWGKREKTDNASL